MQRLAHLAWIASAAVLFGCATSEPSRSLYQWTDAAGNVRYTAFPDRIAIARQQTRRVVEAGASARQNSAPPGIRIPPPPKQLPGAPPVDPSDPLAMRIAELAAHVAADEETLKALISDPKVADRLRNSPELRAVGERLPRLQAELEQLRAERTARDDAERAARDGS